MGSLGSNPYGKVIMPLSTYIDTYAIYTETDSWQLCLIVDKGIHGLGYLFHQMAKNILRSTSTIDVKEVNRSKK